MSDIKPPPEVFTLPVVLCPSCGHGIDPHGLFPGSSCGVGYDATYTYDGNGVRTYSAARCECMWSPNDIAATLSAEARAEVVRLNEQNEVHTRAYLDEQERAEALRAEVSKYSAEIDRMVRELSDIRMEHEAEVAALRNQLDGGITAIRRAASRDTLAVLRAKVQGLRVVESRVKGRRTTVLVDRDDVLALFDGGEDRD